MKTSELIGPALDWAVAKCEGLDPETLNINTGVVYSIRHGHYTPSTHWSQGGPIIERERIVLCFDYAHVTTESGKNITVGNGWRAYITPREYWMTPRGKASGETPLIAAMRCFCASRLGDEVEVPDEIA